MTILDRIKELSKSRDKTVKEVAIELGLGENYLYSLKNKIPNGQTLQKLADYFHVSVDYLLGREKNGETQTPEFSTLQRRARNLSRADQRRLLKIMDLTFTDIDNGELDEDDSEDF
ncbi:helix-turn-helix domain-containing protein [Lactococcus cremoris]|uniref:helix-turn-helix domain-containing protein n=2 Tax=Lactococcus lactis subsp. cremoris TaxID=1359 RepID=UPI0024BCCECA|nr:helix-turn-helix transcriptional regulator [Lactococcus cremoris]